jgi:hypothetical protein
MNRQVCDLVQNHRLLTEDRWLTVALVIRHEDTEIAQVVVLDSLLLSKDIPADDLATFKHRSELRNARSEAVSPAPSFDLNPPTVRETELS